MISFLRNLNKQAWLVPVTLSAWVLLNLWQSIFTELFHDEAYYWVFSKHLAWGYAEHAPLIAVLIRAGSLLVDGELGVRLFPVLLNGGAMYLLTLMAKPKQKLLWFLLIFSMFEVHIGGFFAAPDAPLIFFTTLFFYAYRKYLAEESVANTALLTLAVIGMAYSKYHGFMILGCTLLSNPGLMRKKSFWGLVLISALAFAPVLDWLIEQQFATFRFHLFNRVRRPNDGSFTLNYVVTQFLVTGPLVGILVIPAALLYRMKDRFERALYFSVVGVLSFLFLLSLKSWVEANWSASAVIPMSLLTFFYIRERPKWKTWLIRLGVPSLLIVALFRLNLVLNFLPAFTQARNEVHGWEEWAHEIEAVAGEKTVVFFNSYKLPAKYEFYTGKPAFTLDNYLYHKTQYDNWPIEQRLQGQNVWFVSSYLVTAMDTLPDAVGQPFYHRPIDNFRSYNRVEIQREAPVTNQFEADSSYQFSLLLTNGHEQAIDLGANPDMPPHLVCAIFQDGKLFKHYRNKEQPLSQRLEVGAALSVNWSLQFDLPPGNYEMIFSLRYGWLEGGIHGSFEKFEIVE